VEDSIPFTRSNLGSGKDALEPGPEALTGTPHGKSSAASRPAAEVRAIRAADAKEVGVGNPAEETYRYPNQIRAYYKVSSHHVNA
jgi:hypothetical protein